MAMFAVATWALALALAGGWTEGRFRTFYLFGAILNIPYLALGSVFLVVGRRAGAGMLLALGAFSSAAIAVTLSAPLAGPLPTEGLPTGSELFTFPGPRLWAALGGGVGAVAIVALAVVSIFRFWRRDRQVVASNALIVAGTLAASTGGTGLALGVEEWMAISLLLASGLIWAGYRVASSRGDSAVAGQAGPEPGLGSVDDQHPGQDQHAAGQDRDGDVLVEEGDAAEDADQRDEIADQ